MSFDEKKYAINGSPASANDLIELARQMDDKYDRDWLHSTSEAAHVLRRNGYTVGYAATEAEIGKGK